MSSHFVANIVEVLSKSQYNQHDFSNIDEIYKWGIFIAAYLIASGFLFSSKTVATEFNNRKHSCVRLIVLFKSSVKIFLYYLSKLVKIQDGSLSHYRWLAESAHFFSYITLLGEKVKSTMVLRTMLSGFGGEWHK